MGLSAGTRLGPYEITAPLGSGGMGEVYRARDTRLDRTVAIKVLNSSLASSPELKQRFEREARAVSKLNHPHISTLHDIGQQDGTDYLVMEFLEGESLADRLRRGALPSGEVLKIGIEIADALDKAHRIGIVHRDIKPGNIMLTPSGGAKLLDFGLAKPLNAMASAASSSGSAPSFTAAPTITSPSPISPLTTEGTVLGTVQYMSPEQIEGKEADARSDIFSFGAVLYELVTGKRAFQGKSQLKVASAILEDDPQPVSAIQANVPVMLEHVISTCLAKNPDERFQSAADLKLELQWAMKVARDTASAAHVAERAYVRPIMWVSIGVALVAIAGTAYFARVALQPKQVVQVVHATLVPPEKISIHTGLGVPVLSPDATKLAFVGVDDKGRQMLYVRALNADTVQALSGTDGAFFPFWSPDSNSVGFFADHKIRRIEAWGGSVLTLTEYVGQSRGGAWGENGVIIFATDTDEILRQVPAHGGTASDASRLAAGEADHFWPHFLPDGKHFLFWSQSAQTVCIGELGSLDHKVLFDSASAAIYADGYLLFVRNVNLLAQPFSLSKLATTGDAVPVAGNVAANLTLRGSYVYSASENGLLVYQGGQIAATWPLAWYNRDGKLLGNVGKAEAYAGPAISPDGQRVAVAIVASPTREQSDIWVFDLVRGTQSRLTFDGQNRDPLWSADGKSIFYYGAAPDNCGGSSANASASSESRQCKTLYIKAADNSGQPEALVPSIGPTAWSSISADGRYIAYMRNSDHPGWSFDIYGVDLRGDRKPFPVVRTPFLEALPSLSPDGKWMAYASNESGERNQIYITAFPGGGGKSQVSTAGGLEPRWRGDGKELFFSNSNDRIMAVDVATSSSSVALGVPHQLFEVSMQSAPLGQYDVSRDGQKFLVNSLNAAGASNPLTLVTNWTAALKK